MSDCKGTALTLVNVKATDPGATNRNCTSIGCLFGPPLPIPNSASTPTKIRDFRYGTSYYLLLAMPGIAAAEQKLRGISFRRSQDCA